MTVKQITFYTQDCREYGAIEGAPPAYVRYGTLMQIADTAEAENLTPQLIWQYDKDKARQRGRGKHDVPDTYSVNGVVASLNRTGCFRAAVYTVNLTVDAPNYQWYYAMELESDSYLLGYVAAEIQP